LNGTGKRQTLSVVIPTKDAAQLLGDCLATVSWADEIIAVDMFSTDETSQIFGEYPQCRFFQRRDYIEGNANFGFEQATSDWVLRIDADERHTPELTAEIQEILASPPDGVTGYEFWVRPVILGRELKHGFGRRHYRKMMFRRGMARYPVESEHQDLETSGIWLRTKHGYLHYNYASVAQYLDKTNYYTTNDADRTPLSKRPPRIREAVRETVRAWYLYYLKYRGYRDGWVGFIDAGMRGFYQFTYWAKLRERWDREYGSPS
jgi:glycosyltransferase involved in cell wall biosynthesis